MVQFSDACNLLPILIPNLDHFVSEKYLNKLSGVILTGGNSLSHLGGNAQNVKLSKINLLYNREETTVDRKCRGMQVLQNYYEVPIEKVDDHVGTRHSFF